jgi:dihydrofolate reductase
MSLDGKIAGPHDDVSWLDAIPNPDQLDYGYNALQEEIDTTIMGNGTYQWIKRQPIPFPYVNTQNFVITRNQTLVDNNEVSFLKENVVTSIASLKQQEGKHIWLIGGAAVNKLCLDANLIDEMRVFVMPIILGEGLSLFSDGYDRKLMRLVSSGVHSSGVVEMKYDLLSK